MSQNDPNTPSDPAVSIEFSDADEAPMRRGRDIPEHDIQPLPNQDGIVVVAPWRPKGGEFFLTSQYYEREDGVTFASLAEPQNVFDESKAAMVKLVKRMGKEYGVLVSPDADHDAIATAARHAIEIVLGDTSTTKQS